MTGAEARASAAAAARRHDPVAPGLARALRFELSTTGGRGGVEEVESGQVDSSTRAWEVFYGLLAGAQAGEPDAVRQLEAAAGPASGDLLSRLAKLLDEGSAEPTFADYLDRLLFQPPGDLPETFGARAWRLLDDMRPDLFVLAHGDSNLVTPFRAGGSGESVDDHLWELMRWLELRWADADVGLQPIETNGSRSPKNPARPVGSGGRARLARAAAAEVFRRAACGVLADALVEAEVIAEREDGGVAHLGRVRGAHDAIYAAADLFGIERGELGDAVDLRLRAGRAEAP